MLTSIEKIERLFIIQTKIKLGHEDFMCNAYEEEYGYSDLLEDIPEILNFRPGNKYAWFNDDEVGRRKRIEVINKTIELIKAKI